VRYGTLHHPGDLFSYDIFTQAGLAVRGDGKGVHPLQGFDVKRLFAIGQSQSAGRLTTYVDAIQPLANVYDGFMLYSRGATPAPLGDRLVNGNDPTIPAIARIRTDLNVPVFTFEPSTTSACFSMPTRVRLTRTSSACGRWPERHTRTRMPAEATP
jgi:hypothetical protein